MTAKSRRLMRRKYVSIAKKYKLRKMDDSELEKEDAFEDKEETLFIKGIVVDIRYLENQDVELVLAVKDENGLYFEHKFISKQALREKGIMSWGEDGHKCIFRGEEDEVNLLGESIRATMVDNVICNHSGINKRVSNLCNIATEFPDQRQKVCINYDIVKSNVNKLIWDYILGVTEKSNLSKRDRDYIDFSLERISTMGDFYVLGAFKNLKSELSRKVKAKKEIEDTQEK